MSSGSAQQIRALIALLGAAALWACGPGVRFEVSRWGEDAGADAGLDADLPDAEFPDAGLDAGAQADAGSDAGADAGPQSFTIGGTVGGLSGGSVTLALNGADPLVVTADGFFTFSTPVPAGSSWAVTVRDVTPGLACAIVGGSGTATSDVTDVTVGCLAPAVAPVYPGFPNWLDFLRNDGADVFSASAAACVPASAMGPRGYYECLHGGQMRSLTLTAETSCAGLAAADSEDAFEWRCDTATGLVRFRSVFLNPGKGLANLIEPAGAARFKPLSLAVSRAGGVIARTAPATWWGNPVVDLPAGGISGGAAGTLYAVRSDLSLGGAVYLTGERMALVTLPGATLSTGLSTESDLYLFDVADFCWVEGTFDLIRTRRVFHRETRFLTARNVTVLGHLAPGELGFDLCGATQGLFENLRSQNMADALFTVNGGLRCTFRGVRGSQSALSGLHLGDVCQPSRQNVFEDVVLADSPDGVGSGGAVIAVHDNRYIGTTVIGSSTGLDLGVGDLTLATTSVGGSVFAALGAQGRTTLVNSAFVNSATDLSLDYAGRNQLVDLAAVSGSVALLLGTEDNYFSGVLKVAGSNAGCSVSGATRPGLVDGTCANNGISDAVPDLGPDLTSTFVGKVSSDSANAQGAAGRSAFGAISDWLDFASPWRAWGRDGAGMTDPALQGPCSAGTCQIWDAALRSTDTELRGELSLPTGDHVVDHVWYAPDAATCALIAGATWGPVCNLPGYTAQSTCEAAGGDWTTSKCWSRFLRRARELSRDLIGNDNGLCESGETCLFTPNLGSYQGHGALVSAGTFVPGKITGVTLLKYSSNGY